MGEPCESHFKEAFAHFNCPRARTDNLMSEIPEPQRPIPQYTIRWMLGMTSVWGVIFSIVALAMRGHIWALGISVAVGSLAVFMLACASLFAVVWVFSAPGDSKETKSASDRLQIADDGSLNSFNNSGKGQGIE
jgi:hypothetical protein